MTAPLDAARRERIDALFDAALDQPEEARAAWLAHASGDPAVLAEVRALLAAHARAAGILDGGGARPAVTDLLPDPLRGRRVGPYRLVRELGRGGMGVVYLAERDDGQFKQRVALKLLRGTPDAEELHRRFRAERQILASLSHPNIAQLLDGGVTDGWLPYIVMEHVEGEPITEYCDRRQLTVAERLRLFQSVCAAVHHAHQNLVVHRDLKPGNVLVTEAGQPKLLDFGIAKLLNPTLSGVEEAVTRTAFRLMTPEYASPEQVLGSTITTASDVYSLGVVLYELLAGRRPFDAPAASAHELARIVCEREPERPSTRATRTTRPGAGPPDATTRPDPLAIADARGTSVERLRRELSGDLDAIVLLAMRKEPKARYGSADLLAEDIQRYLDGLPVMAQHAGQWYRLRKLVARHRVWAGATAAVALSLVVGSGVALRQAAVAARERDRAEGLRAEAEQALRQSEEMTHFLVGLFDAENPIAAPSGGLTTETLLRRGETQVRALAAQPLVQARMLEAMARINSRLAQYGQAREQLEQALSLRRAQLGDAHVEVASTLYYLGDVLRRQGRYAEAERTTRRALEIRRTALGEGHPAVAEVLAQLAGLAVYRGALAESESLAARALEIRRAALRDDDPTIGTSLELLGATQRRLGRSAAAESSLRAAVALRLRTQGPTHPDAAYSMLRLADVLATESQHYGEAESLYRRALAVQRAALGDTHPRVTAAMGDLSELLAKRGAHAEAIRLERDALTLQRRIYGDPHPSVAMRHSLLAARLLRAGQLEEAEREYRLAIGRLERHFGAEHPSLAGPLYGFGETRASLGALVEAESIYARATRIRVQATGDERWRAFALTQVAALRTRAGAHAAADSLLRVALATYRRRLPEDHPDVRDTYRALAAVNATLGRTAEAARFALLAGGDR